MFDVLYVSHNATWTLRETYNNKLVVREPVGVNSKSICNVIQITTSTSIYFNISNII